MVVDGKVYQVQSTGRVSEAPPTAGVPFGVVTRFTPGIDLQIGSIGNFRDLEKCCDAHRTSGNIFYAFRFDGIVGVHVDYSDNHTLFEMAKEDSFH